MQYRQFGDTDLKVSVMGLGCSRLGGSLGSGNQKETVKMLHQANEAGVNFYDTADSYGQGQSEILLGKTFKNQREKVIFASKAGYYLSPLGNIAAKFKPILKPLVRSLRSLKSSNSKANSLSDARSSVLRQNFNPDYLINTIQGSLKRLQTDYLDLFQLHSPPSEIISTPEVWQTLEKLKKQGKIRYYGVSCDTVEDALICLQQPGLSGLQLEINLLNQEAIAKVLPIAQEQNKAVIARQPFASGLLLKLSEDEGQEKPNNKVLEAQNYKFLTQSGSRSLPQAALQFLFQLDGVSVAIPSASSCKHLAENLGALTAPPLTEAELQAIGAIAAVSK